MIRNKVLLVAFMLCFVISAFGQNESSTDTLPDPQKEQAKAMVEAVEYYFNLLGSKRTKTQEKETIINESYKKLFLNDRVQVEDDLQENRSTQIFKDIQAYLKDIDFFFKEVVFDFEINGVERLFTRDSIPYFKADITRNLNAIGIAGDTLKISGQRFIELNFDGPQKEIKVASIYTNKINRERQLKAWWLDLSVGWKQIFKEEIGIYDDSLTVDELTRIAGMDSLDLSGNSLVVNLDPIYVLTDLSYLKLSNSFITDLSPLLSINRLKVLDISQTSVHELSALKYHTDIETMILSDSHVTDFGVLGFFDKLKSLDLRGAVFDDLSFLNPLSSLLELNLSKVRGANTIDFSGLKELRKLVLDQSDLSQPKGFEGLVQLGVLNLEGTNVVSVENLSRLTQLSVLNIANTGVTDINPLVGLQSLKKVYADGLILDEAQVDDFVKNNSALLVRNTKELAAWWEVLSTEWKTLLSRELNIPDPSPEQLVRLLNIESLNADNSGIITLEPVSLLKKLSALDMSNNNIKSLSGIAELTDLKRLKLSNTNVTDFSPLKSLVKLETVEAENTRIRDIDVLAGLKALSCLNVDGASVEQKAVSALISSIPTLKVRFQTGVLNQWWSGLSEELTRIFRENMTLSDEPTSDQLHELAGIKEIEVNGPMAEGDLSSFDQLFRLESLILTRTGLSNLDRLLNVSTLKSLTITETPMDELNSLLKFKGLTKLDVSNTAITDLSDLSLLINLKELNFSGTTVKRLRGLDTLVNLEIVDCSNTRVSRLDDLYLLPELKQVTCFNSRLNSKDIENLKEAQPKVKVVYY